MKKIIIFLLVVTFVLTLSPAAVFADGTELSGACGDNLTWTLSEDGTLVISGTGNMWNYAFAENNQLALPPWHDDVKNAIVEEGVTGIGNYAFAYCHKLENISLPDSLSYIGESAFKNSETFTSIILPEQLETIERAAFFHSAGLK